MIKLEWKTFKIDLKIVDEYFERNYSDYDNMVCDEFATLILFKKEPSNKVIKEIEQFWNSLVEKTEEELNLEQTKSNYLKKLSNRTFFSNDFIQDLLFYNQEFNEFLLIKDLIELLKYGYLEEVRDELEVLYNSTENPKYLILFDKIQIFLKKE